MSRIGVIVLAVCAIAAFGVHKRQAAASGGGAVAADQRAAGLRFAPGVTAGDQAWIVAAVGAARPEARRLIDEIDGLVEVRTDLAHEQAIGMAEMHGDSATIHLDARLLNGERAVDRGAVVLHELGHVVDFVLVDDAVRQQMDAAIPRLGTSAVEERFAETFAKWALNGRVSIAGDGYGIPNPPSLEDWGAPLSRLAIELDLDG
jgi:hypothetical protein